MQSIARDSDDSSDEEFFDAHGNHCFDFKLKAEVGSDVRYAHFFFFPRYLLAPLFNCSACISLTADQFLSFPDTQHALGLQLK